MMSLIKGKDTQSELAIRKRLFAHGFRYRLHYKKLPGKPDIVLPRYRAVIFLNGCFWHVHNCDLFKWPATRNDFWKKKLNRNKKLDKINNVAILKLGWRVLTIWECSFRGTGSRKGKTFDAIFGKVTKWLTGKKLTEEIKG